MPDMQTQDAHRAPFLRAARLLFAFLLSAALTGLNAEAVKAPAEEFSQALADLKQQTALPILLPAHLPPMHKGPVYATASGDAGSYAIRIESDPDCDHANACYLGIFRAKRDGRLSFPDAVTIGKDTQGRYQETSCGASCSAPSIQWKSKDVVYTVQLNLSTADEKQARKWMIDLASESILAGPR